MKKYALYLGAGRHPKDDEFVCDFDNLEEALKQCRILNSKLNSSKFYLDNTQEGENKDAY